MSRSRKKVPIYKDQTTRKYGKKQANKAVRRRKEESFKGKEYRKVYSSWDISDYILFYSKEQAIKDWYAEEIFQNTVNPFIIDIKQQKNGYYIGRNGTLTNKERILFE